MSDDDATRAFEPGEAPPVVDPPGDALAPAADAAAVPAPGPAAAGIEADAAPAPAAVASPDVAAAPDVAPVAGTPPVVADAGAVAPAPVVPVPSLIVAPPPSRARTLLGPALWLAGAVLWIYVIVGEYVVEANLPEGIGLVTVLGVATLTWRRTEQRVPTTRQGSLRRAAPVLLSLAFFLGLLFLAAVLFGGTSRSKIEAVSLLMLFLSVIVYAIGRMLTPRAPEQLTGWQRAARVALWFVAVLATLPALVNVLKHM